MWCERRVLISLSYPLILVRNYVMPLYTILRKKAILTNFASFDFHQKNNLIREYRVKNINVYCAISE